MNINEFLNELNKINISLTEKQLSNLETYKNMLQEYNQKFNLTAITKTEDIYLKHFYDSLTLIKACDFKEPLKVLDIGTGAGFPGLVLKIVFPSLDITLVDSNNKKILFLNKVISKLELTNITVIGKRVEDLPNNYREYFDIVTTRAVSNIRIILELAIPYLKVNGYFLPMKGIVTQELEESAKTLEILNCEVTDIIKFLLPIENSNRTIIKIKKLKETPEIYPRTYDKILKKPLR